MEDIENKELLKEESELIYSKEDFENYKAKLTDEFLEKEETIKKEFETEAKKASMSEVELLQLELEEVKQKYQEKENECLIAKQKEETSMLLDEIGLERNVLDLVYVPLNMDDTKIKIEILKNYTEKLKKDTLQGYTRNTLPLISNEIEYDAFIEGFDNNEL